MSLHIETIPNKRGRASILLREAKREGKRIRRTTIANLTDLPPHIIAGFDAIIRGGVAFPSTSDVFNVRRSLPHGHVCAILACCKQIGLSKILSRKANRQSNLALAAIATRIFSPASKLATARALSASTANSSLGPLLGLGHVRGKEMLSMLDWLRDRQPWIAKSLANRHLGKDALLLYDISSSWFEGSCCPLAAFGHSRDGKKGKKQIVYGLLCSADGCPIDIEVFTGNTADPKSVATQVKKIKQRFGISNIALVGDRGMLTTARIRDDLKPTSLDWLSALTNRSIATLLKETDKVSAPIQPDNLKDNAVVEISSPNFPGERLMVCLNPRLREERRLKREELLEATERILCKIASSVENGRLRGKDHIAHRLGREGNEMKVEKHFDIKVTDESLIWQRNIQSIEAEAKFDGIYVIRTSLPVESITAHQTVTGYKNLATVERAFRYMKSDLSVRPFHVYTAEHLRGHLFLCMLAYYVEWHMRRRLAPMLFEDENREAASREKQTPVEPAITSQGARQKIASKKTEDGLPVHSFRTLLEDLATLSVIGVSLPSHPEATVPVIAPPTPVQQRAFDLLNTDPTRFVSSAMTG